MPATAVTARIGSGQGPGRPLGAAGALVTLTLATLTVTWSMRTGVTDTLVLLVTVVPAALLGSVVVAARRRDPVGWSFLTAGLLFLVGTTGHQWTLLGLPWTDVAVWTQTWTYQVGLVPLFVLVPLYFPDSRLPSPRWRPISRAALALAPTLGVVLALTPARGLARRAVEQCSVPCFRARRPAPARGDSGGVHPCAGVRRPHSVPPGPPGIALHQ